VEKIPGDNRRGGLFDQSLHALHVLVNRQKCLLCILLHQARITSGNTGKVKKKCWAIPIWRFPEMGGTRNHPNLDHFSIETHGFDGFGVPPISENPNL